MERRLYDVQELGRAGFDTPPTRVDQLRVPGEGVRALRLCGKFPVGRESSGARPGGWKPIAERPLRASGAFEAWRSIWTAIRAKRHCRIDAGVADLQSHRSGAGPTTVKAGWLSPSVGCVTAHHSTNCLRRMFRNADSTGRVPAFYSLIISIPTTDLPDSSTAELDGGHWGRSGRALPTGDTSGPHR